MKQFRRNKKKRIWTGWIYGMKNLIVDMKVFQTYVHEQVTLCGL